MGCDIHAHIEVRRPDVRVKVIDGKEEWNHFASLPGLGRCYAHFARLAGVRADREGMALVEPRGFPENAAYWTSIEYREDNGDAHTATWLTRAEFEAAVTKSYEEHGNESFGSNKDEYEAVIVAMKALEAAGFEARIVFWFDN